MHGFRAMTANILVLVSLASLACGGPTAGARPTSTATPVRVAAPAPTAQPAPAAIAVPPSPTATVAPPAPTATVVGSTATVTATREPPTATPVPPSPTAAVAPPSPTATVVGSTAAATPTPEPPTATPDPLAALFPYTVTDSNGNEVTFEEPPERIVAIDSAVLETLFAIGEGHRVVGTHDFVSHPPEAADIPRLGGAFNINLEATVVLDPDLVFIFFDGSLVDLDRVDLKVLYQKSLSADFRGVADNIRMWGRITGSPEAAEKVAVQFEARVDRIEEVMATQVGGLAVFQDEGQLWTPGPDTLMGEVFELLKLQNIAYDVSGYAQLSPEVIVERDPAVVIASYGDTISDNPAFENVTAVKSKRVLVPQSDALSIAGPRFIDGIEELAKWLYPDLFD